MKCHNLLCRERTCNNASGCLKFVSPEIENCLQHNLYSAMQVIIVQQGCKPLPELIYDASNEVQKDYFNK